jgi:hypothetical protein
MPLIVVGQNVQARHLEIRSEVDQKSLGYIRTINDTQNIDGKLDGRREALSGPGDAGCLKRRTRADSESRCHILIHVIKDLIAELGVEFDRGVGD